MVTSGKETIEEGYGLKVLTTSFVELPDSLIYDIIS